MGTGNLREHDKGTGTWAGVGPIDKGTGNGSVAGGFGATHDGTGELLELGAGFYRSVLESLSEGVIITDRESRVLFANRRMEEMTGWTPGELVGRISYEVLAPPELWAAMRRRLEERLAGEEEAYENELVRKDGSRHWIQVRASPYRDSAGRIQGTIGAMSCIQRQKELEQENTRLLDVLAAERGFPDIVGNSPALRKVLEQVTMVGATDASVLILGESGTGKELVARAIHEAGSRREHPLVRVNCASIPKELFESEFFGHVKGAFTGAIRDRMGRFEMADRGTLFLDEVGEIPPDLQAKLLRVLQEGTLERVGEERTRRVDVRIIAATNRDLLATARSGAFRLDLYYRLSVFPMELPPLRERREDIRPLAEHFLTQVRGKLGIRRLRVPAEQWALLETYDWPGNVRELQNVIERAAILARSGEVSFEGLLQEGARAGEESAPMALPETMGEVTRPATLQGLREAEREMVARALEASGGRIYGEGGAAERLGLRPTTLTSKLRRWGWERGRWQAGPKRRGAAGP